MRKCVYNVFPVPGQPAVTLRPGYCVVTCTHIGRTTYPSVHTGIGFCIELMGNECNNNVLLLCYMYVTVSTKLLCYSPTLVCIILTAYMYVPTRMHTCTNIHVCELISQTHNAKHYPMLYVWSALQRSGLNHECNICKHNIILRITVQLMYTMTLKAHRPTYHL